jgi:putative endonuclease
MKNMRVYLFYVYILTNDSNKVLYTGVTNDLERRCIEHSSKRIKGFTSHYNVHKLIYYERFEDIEIAIRREKQIKDYSRKKKEYLINNYNPKWEELFVNGRVTKPQTKLATAQDQF